MMDVNVELKPLHNEQEINQQWLEKMLSQKFGCSVAVNFWSSTLPRSGEGFLSEIALVNIEYTVNDNKQKEIRLVFKFLPKDTNLKSFLANGGLAKREVEFYHFTSSPKFQEVFHKTGVSLPVPEAYYAGFTEEAITIVMRDLSVDKYKSVIVRDGSTLSQTKTALQAVALVHAAGVIYLQKHKQNDGLGALAADFNTDFMDQFFIPNLNTLSEMYKGSSLAKTFRALIPLTKQIRSTSKRYPLLNTVVHGDLWAGQLLYSEDESSANLIDWQFCHVSNPVSDIMSMFFMSSDPEIFEENLDEILESYWHTFTETVTAGGASVDITLEQLMINIEEMWMHGFMVLAVSIHDFLSADNISESRLFRAFNFLEKKGVFKRFLAKFGNQEEA
ncbi:uncharacterized oxidoreductase dhs-27-like [Panulirus ornatus]|uniref:uncharacterized oxidoreductase dhs-27-like n=1 Tax=Panulirus ornatus TaxID=150431 RepID=UPI003A89350F